LHFREIDGLIFAKNGLTTKWKGHMNIKIGSRNVLYHQRVIILKWDLNKIGNLSAIPCNAKVFTAEVEDLREIHSDSDFDLKVYPWDFLREKVKSGLWKCVLAKIGEDVAGYTFYTPYNTEFVGSKKVEFILPPRSSYLFRTFVNPKFRNMGIGKLVGRERIRQVRERGDVQAYVAVNSTNSISLHNNTKLGAEIIGSINFFKAKFFNIALCSPRLAYSGLRLKS
jgi:GNAT superfamily N-acetyltransferase